MRVLHFERGRRKTAQREFDGYRTLVIDIYFIRFGRGDEFEQKAVRISQTDDRLAETRVELLGGHAEFFETLFPKLERIRRNSISGCYHLAGAARAAPGARP